MNNFLARACVTLFGLGAIAAQVSGQSSPVGKNNNPYSPSPAASSASPSRGSAFPSQPDIQRTDPRMQRVAFTVGKGPADPKPLAPISSPEGNKPGLVRPTDIYLIGVGDVLSINLKNSAAGTRYYQVAQDGTIDCPLANKLLKVSGMTSEGVAETLRASIKLYANPQVDVKIDRYMSHTVNVTGMVDNGGEKYLRREAMPLFVLRAESEAKREAKAVRIKRSGSGTPEMHDLADPATDNILVFDGDTVEFIAARPAAASYYTISGEVNAAGKRELLPGMTLSKAIAAAGGVRGKAVRALIRRAGPQGTAATEIDLSAIAKKRAVDPLLIAGDVIEIRK